MALRESVFRSLAGRDVWESGPDAIRFEIGSRDGDCVWVGAESSGSSDAKRVRARRTTTSGTNVRAAFTASYGDLVRRFATDERGRDASTCVPAFAFSTWDVVRASTRARGTSEFPAGGSAGDELHREIADR